MTKMTKKKKPPTKQTGLTAKQEAFAVLLAKGANSSDAYRQAFPRAKLWKSTTVWPAASKLAETYKVRTRVSELLAAAAKANEVSVADVLAKYLAVLRADPRKLIAHHRYACRYCHGDGHRCQYTPAEFDQAKTKHQAARAEDPSIGEFDPKGGSGFGGAATPHPDCPECFGEGIGRVIVGDTRDFGPDELALYAGVKATKDGIEVKMADQLAALAQVARHVGFFREDNRVEVVATSAEELDAVFGERMRRAQARQAAVIAARREGARQPGA